MVEFGVRNVTLAITEENDDWDVGSETRLVMSLDSITTATT
jgi:hypothetical protein